MRELPLACTRVTVGIFCSTQRQYFGRVGEVVALLFLVGSIAMWHPSPIGPCCNRTHRAEEEETGLLFCFQDTDGPLLECITLNHWLLSVKECYSFQLISCSATLLFRLDQVRLCWLSSTHQGFSDVSWKLCPRHNIVCCCQHSAVCKGQLDLQLPGQEPVPVHGSFDTRLDRKVKCFFSRFAEVFLILKRLP